MGKLVKCIVDSHEAVGLKKGSTHVLVSETYDKCSLIVDGSLRQFPKEEFELIMTPRAGRNA